MASAQSNGNSFSDSVDELDLNKCDIGGQKVKKKRPTFGFDTKTTKTDLVLVFEEKKMYVTKVVLEMVSPVFESMFSENLKNSGENEIMIEGKDYHDFAEFLACFYPGKVLKVTLENVYRIQSLAFEYEVDCLKTACKSVLAESLKDTNTETNLFKCMDVAYRYNIEELKTKCLKQAIQIYQEDISRSDELLQMENSYKDDIWKSIYPTLRSDASKFRFWSTAAKHTSGSEYYFEYFNDAKYVTTNCKLNWYQIWDTGKEKTIALPMVFDGLTIKVTVKKVTEQVFKVYNINKSTTINKLQFDLCAVHDDENAKASGCSARLVIEFINTIPWKQNLFHGHCSYGWPTITTKPSMFTSIGPENFESQEKGFVLNQQIKIRIHLLVNRPVINVLDP